MSWSLALLRSVLRRGREIGYDGMWLSTAGIHTVRAALANDVPSCLLGGGSQKEWMESLGVLL